MKSPASVYFTLSLTLLTLVTIGNNSASSRYTPINPLEVQPRACSYFGSRVDNKSIFKRGKPILRTNPLYEQLKLLKKLFKVKSEIKLREIKDPTLRTAVAHSHEVSDIKLTNIISINLAYYDSLMRDRKKAEKQALYICILAHELTHHRREDLFVDTDRSTLHNLEKELNADFEAGYAVGFLTKVDMKFFDEVLRLVIKSTTHSDTHPARKFRIFAAKAGWLKAMAEKDKEKGKKYREVTLTYNNLGAIYQLKKQPSYSRFGWFDYHDGSQYFGYFNGTSLEGEGVLLSTFPLTGKTVSLYMGGFYRDKKSSLGDEYDNQNGHYKGHWKDDTKHGQGTYVVKSEFDILEESGNWAEDKLNGFGFRKRNGKTEFSGEWKDGKPLK